MRTTLERWRSKRPDVGAEPGGEGGFVEGSGGEAEDGLCSGFLGGGEMIAVQFEEEDADEEAGALFAVDERVVADNACGVVGSHVYDVRVIAIGVELLRPGKGGLKQVHIAYAGSAAVEGEKAVMEREGVALVDPNRFTHFASVCRVLR